ncbi:hypothetical protein GWI33_000633, partial [Rhynchophorus ferrugineus]
DVILTKNRKKKAPFQGAKHEWWKDEASSSGGSLRTEDVGHFNVTVNENYVESVVGGKPLADNISSHLEPKESTKKQPAATEQRTKRNAKPERTSNSKFSGAWIY